MSKRKLANEDDEGASASVKKHSLDSDEEDEDVDSKKYEIMDEDDIEGQEEATIEFDGDIRITPFNMKEELEEGHFDKDGNYFLKKDQEVRDVWLDNIDWVKIKAKENPENIKDGDDESDSSDDGSVVKVDHMETFKKIVAYMDPGETILQAIKRLGKKSGSQSNASSRWKTKNRNRRSGGPSGSSEDAAGAAAADATEDDGADVKKMLELTELADGLVHRGWMEIYQETYEKLKHRIRLREDVGKKVNLDDDDALDMFADNFDEKNKAPAAASTTTTTTIGSQNGGSNPTGDKKSSEIDAENANLAGAILWQFKWENADEAEIYGPHTSQEMSRWVDDGYFKEVWVRRVDQPEAQFYTSKRIDFDLYV